MIETNLKLIPDTSKQLLKDTFKTVDLSGQYDFFRLDVNGDVYGLLCLEYKDSVCLIHPHFFKEYRTKTKMLRLVKGFTEVVCPYVASKGCSQIAAQCDYSDTRAMRLFKFFGFNVTAWWVGTLEV